MSDNDHEFDTSKEENELSEDEQIDELADEAESISEDSDIERDDELENVTGRDRVSVGGVDVVLAGQNLDVNLVVNGRNVIVNGEVLNQDGDVNVVVNGQNINVINIINDVSGNQNDDVNEIDDENDEDLELDDQNDNVNEIDDQNDEDMDDQSDDENEDMLDNQNDEDVVELDEPTGLNRGSRRSRPKPVPRPMPVLHFRSMKISSYVVNHTSSTETIQSHPAAIILPPEVLEMITAYNVKFPIFFELTNPENSNATCCGVSMFTAERGTCGIPDWIMENLNLNDGDIVSIVPKTLVKGEYAKLEPQSVDFLKISNPKRDLEDALSKFSCISTGDIITIFCDAKFYKVKVLETKPARSICITNSDLKVEFAPPVGYVDPSEVVNSGPFPGKGYRLNGTDVPTTATSGTTSVGQRGVPDWQFKIGEIVFNRRPKKANIQSSPNLNTTLEPFSGAGFTTGVTTTDGKSRIADEIVNSRPNSDRESSDATPSKVPRTGNAKDVSEFTSGEKSADFQHVIEEEINPNVYDELFEEDIFSASEDEAEEEEPSSDEPEPDDPNDPDYTEDMDID